MYLPVIHSITHLMQKVTIALSGSDYEALNRLKQQLSKKHADVKVEKANLENLPGAIGNLSILGITVSVVSEPIASAIGGWLYDAIKKAAPEAKIEVHINGKRVSARDQIQSVFDKKAGKQQRPGKQQ